ncbi:MAG: O-acetyl-ADP-ribose deacetylase [Firmicutes bacterium]|nr:O-acetyl-ADP-ribose deacetylase [Bacillota bacterium]
MGTSLLEIVRGDITQQDTEAIVNAANKRLAPGGGVAGAIHRAAGPELWDECQNLDGCETGEAKISAGYRLKARHVVHTVGPVYNNTPQNAVDLENCYLNSLRLAKENGIRSIAFPAISTGIFGYPLQEAAEISLRAVINFLQQNSSPDLVRFVLFGANDFQVYEETLQKIRDEKGN